jgi:hypothetical protein
MRATPKTGSRPLVIEGQAPQFGFKKTNDVLRVCAKRVRAPIQACAHRLGAHYVGHEEWNGMNNFFNDLQGKINQAFDSSPAKDIERNVKAIMTWPRRAPSSRRSKCAWPSWKRNWRRPRPRSEPASGMTDRRSAV